MLYWSLMFLVLALVAAFFGFGSVAGTAASISQVLFFLFFVALIVTFFMGRGRRPPIA